MKKIVFITILILFSFISHNYAMEEGAVTSAGAGDSVFQEQSLSKKFKQRLRIGSRDGWLLLVSMASTEGMQGKEKVINLMRELNRLLNLLENKTNIPFEIEDEKNLMSNINELRIILSELVGKEYDCKYFAKRLFDDLDELFELAYEKIGKFIVNEIVKNSTETERGKSLFDEMKLRSPQGVKILCYMSYSIAREGRKDIIDLMKTLRSTNNNTSFEDSFKILKEILLRLAKRTKYSKEIQYEYLGGAYAQEVFNNIEYFVPDEVQLKGQQIVKQIWGRESL